MTKARDLANVISGSGVLAGGVIPDLPASKITSGTIASARLSLSASDIPNLATSKITSGTFDNARLSSGSVTQHVDLTALSASNLTSGTVPSARLSLGASDIPALATSKITSGTFADARFAASNITQHVDLSNLNASNLTSGTVPDARVSSSSVTAHVSAVTTASGTWSPTTSSGSQSVDSARYMRVGNLVSVTCWVSTTGSAPAYNQTIWTLGGLPYTPVNTGTSDDVVGLGEIRSAGGSMSIWVLSGNSTIQIGSGRYAADADNSGLSNSTSTSLDTINKAVQYNQYAWWENGADKHYQLQLNYYV